MSSEWPTDVAGDHEASRAFSKTQKRLLSTFGRPFQPSPDVRPPSADETAARERVIANIRLLFAVVSLVVAFLAASDPDQKNLTLGVLGVYALYSLGLFIAVRL